MDVVYYVRPGERNEELRYSLRSLRNLPHERVWIIGHKPSWVAGVEYVPGNRQHDPYSNAIDNLSLACDAVPGDEFVVFNDDFYLTEGVAAIPTCHRGLLSERTTLYAPLRAARRKLAELGITDPLDWTLHTPLVVARDALRRVLARLTSQEWRTMYGNLTGLQGERMADVKVRRRSDPIPAGPFLSSSDATFPSLRQYLDRLFPDPSPYEAAS